MATYRRSYIATKQAQDRERENARQVEAMRAATQQALFQDRILTENASSRHRVDHMRRQRVLQEEQRDLQLLSALEGEVARKQALETQRRQEAALEAELENQRRAALKEEKTRAYLRANAVELRELQAQLNTAYTAKELYSQRETKLRATQAANAETIRFGKAIDEDVKQAAIEAEEKRQAMRQQAVAYRGDLKAQLADNAAAKAAAMQEYLKEKAAIDALVSKIYAEDAAMMERELRAKARTREELDAFMRDRAALAAAKEKEVQAENARIQRQLEEMAQRGAGEKEKKQEKTAAMEALANRLGMQRQEELRAQEEWEKVRMVLHQEEMDQRQAARERQDMEHRIKQRIELTRAFAEDATAKVERQAQAAQEEEAFRAAMLDKLAREDRIEQLNAQKRRLKAAEHKRAVETLIDERRARMALEKMEIAQGTAAEQAEQAERHRIIEEERQRLLAEHAHRLLGFLPKSAISGRGDVERLGADFQDFYRPRTSPDDDDDDDY